MPKKSIWTDTTSKYGTYKGARGNPAQWSATFDQVFTQSDTIQSIIGMSAFTVLGIEPTASDEIVKRAYRRLVKIHRADREGDDPTQFRKIQNAYDTIMNMRHPRKQVEVDNDMNTARTMNNSNTDCLYKDHCVLKDDHGQRPNCDTCSCYNFKRPTVPTDLIIPQLLTEIDKSELEQYLNDPDFCAQEKKDGKHLTLQILNNQLIVRNRKGISCGCAPEFEPSLRQCNYDILIDGEQVNGIFWTWDILELDGLSLRNLPYHMRHAKLSSLSFGPNIKVLKYASTKEEKRALYNYLWSACKEGIVFKRLSATYSSGKNNDALKLKFYAECSVIIVAGRPNKASIGMELINDQGQREFVGYCSCNRRPPINSIGEIKYLYAYRGGCLYQPSFKELRDDIDISECTISQLKFKSAAD
jgi:bifunctional non-homologous end joining protein LigD